MNIQIPSELILTGLSIIVSVATVLITNAVYWGRKLEQFDMLKKDCEEMQCELKAVNRELAVLGEFKLTAQKIMDSKIFQSKSPLTLTEFGQKLITESGFVKIFDTVKDDLVTKLLNLHPSTKYDVQEKARQLMDGLVDYQAFQPLKEYAYNSGNDYAQILRAGAIPLRDYFLDKHPEITKP